MAGFKNFGILERTLVSGRRMHLKVTSLEEGKPGRGPLQPLRLKKWESPQGSGTGMERNSWT